MGTVSVKKNGIISTIGTINKNLCNWGYSRTPYIPNTAGSTILSVEIKDSFTRYTATTAGNDGGKYGYPWGSGNLIQGTIYTWSMDIRASSNITLTNGRIGFEGGGMLTGLSLTTEWKRISNTWTQSTSQAFVLYPCGSLPNNSWIDVKNLKLELGSIATPFSLPANETGYVGDNHGFIESNANHNGYAHIYKDGFIEMQDFIEI